MAALRIHGAKRIAAERHGGGIGRGTKAGCTNRWIAKGTTLGLLLLFTLSQQDGSWALLGDMQGSFGLDGNIRTIGAVVRDDDFAPFQLSQTILRWTAGGHPNEWLGYEIHWVQALTYQSAEPPQGTADLGAGGGKLRYRAIDAAWHPPAQDRVAAALFLDRFNVKVALPRADITIGRQAITFGKAYFWNPLDVFLPFDPNQFDRDYKAGVDAVRVDLSLGDFSGITLVGVGGRRLEPEGGYADGGGSVHASWYGSSVLARYFTNLAGWDMVIQGGKLYGGYQLGGGLVGEIRGIEARAEAACFWADRGSPPVLRSSAGLLEDAFGGVVGIGYRFANSLVLEFEYFYNGAGETEDLLAALVRLRHGAVLNMSRHLMGFLFSYDLLPIVVGQLAVIVSPVDPSAQVQPSATFSLSDNAELLVGATLGLGQKPELDPLEGLRIRSEFGTFPDLYFAELKYYF